MRRIIDTMAVPKQSSHTYHASWLNTTDRLKKPEVVALLLFVVVSVVLDVIGIFSQGMARPINHVISIAATLALVAYAWWPRAATIALGAVVLVSFAVADAADVITAGAFAAFFVVRLCSTSWIFAYTAVLLITSGMMLSGFGGVNQTNADVGVYLIFAALAGAVGLALRAAYARQDRLEKALQEQAALAEEREREAIQAERRWIAGELHDSIAHYLTIISLHSQLLDDESTRKESQEAIRMASKKALSDLRFVIKLASDTPQTDSAAPGDLSAAIAEATKELEAVGHTVVCTGDPANENIPRGVDLIFARIVRESATNILKYAGAGNVDVTISVAPEDVSLTVESPLSPHPPTNVPSAGTGINRMTQRVLGVSGQFSAGPVGKKWVVYARLPLTLAATNAQ